MSNNVRTQASPVSFGRNFGLYPVSSDDIVMSRQYINHETQLKIELLGINGDLLIQASLKGSSTLYTIYAGTGTDAETIDISGYDFIQAQASTGITQGNAAFSTFSYQVVNVTTSSGDATAANQLSGNATLTQIELNQDSQTTVLNNIATNTQAQPDSIVLVDKTSVTDVIFVGEANPGSSTASAVWKITKIDKSGSVVTILYADGNTNKDNIWNNRVSGSYS